MLLVTLALIGLTVWLYMIVPKGFFPDQDTGLIIGTTRGPPDTSFQAMQQLQEKVVAVVLRDPGGRRHRLLGRRWRRQFLRQPGPALPQPEAAGGAPGRDRRR